MSTPSEQSEPPRPTRMYLVRHGATAANLRRPYVLQGSRVDNPLGELGRQQARYLAEYLKPRAISAVFSSELARARQTAEIVAAPHHLEVRPVAGLQEIDVGLWEGRGWQEIAANDASAYEAFIAAPGAVPYHGGESYADVLDRARPVFRNLLRKHPGESIVVVAHNVVIRAYTAHLMNLDLDFAKNIRQANCGVNVIEDRPDLDRTELVTLNAHEHIPAEYRS